MKENVQAFINRLHERRHLLLLVDNMEISIGFVAEHNQKVSIFFRCGEVYFSDAADKLNDNMVIYGDETAFKLLLDGRETFRRLIERGDIQFSAPFRTQLLLESLFYLGRKEVKTI